MYFSRPNNAFDLAPEVLKYASQAGGLLVRFERGIGIRGAGIWSSRIVVLSSVKL